MRNLFFIAFAAVTLSAQQKTLSWEQIETQQNEALARILQKLDKIQKTQDRMSKILEEADAPPPPPPPVKVDVSGAPALGIDSAPVTIVEFTDMQCPYCNKFHTGTFPKLHDDLIATGKVRFVSRDLPLPMHKNAQQAAEAGRCAGEQGHFWEMRDWMQSNPEQLSLDRLIAHAATLDLDTVQFNLCLETSRYKSAVEADAAEAQKLGIAGTPAFVVGKSGSVITGQLIMGAQPLAAFERAIQAVK